MNEYSIETWYGGAQYRSRTEARWAVLFDAAGVGFQYEPDGFKLETGWYVPDFLITGWDIYFEVKGTLPTEREVWLAEDLTWVTKKDVLIAPGNPDDGFELIKVHTDKVSPTWQPLTELFSSYAIQRAKNYRFEWGNRPRAQTVRKMIKDTAAKLRFPIDDRPGNAVYDPQRIRRA